MSHRHRVYPASGIAGSAGINRKPQLLSDSVSSLYSDSIAQVPLCPGTPEYGPAGDFVYARAGGRGVKLRRGFKAPAAVTRPAEESEDVDIKGRPVLLKRCTSIYVGVMQARDIKNRGIILLPVISEPAAALRAAVARAHRGPAPFEPEFRREYRRETVSAENPGIESGMEPVVPETAESAESERNPALGSSIPSWNLCIGLPTLIDGITCPQRRSGTEKKKHCCRYRFIHIVCRENPCRTMRANVFIRHEAASGIVQI